MRESVPNSGPIWFGSMIVIVCARALWLGPSLPGSLLAYRYEMTSAGSQSFKTGWFGAEHFSKGIAAGAASEFHRRMRRAGGRVENRIAITRANGNTRHVGWLRGRPSAAIGQPRAKCFAHNQSGELPPCRRVHQDRLSRDGIDVQCKWRSQSAEQGQSHRD